jgi:hypothetical protein
MKITIPFGASILALALAATSCTTVARPSAGSGRVYLVGVAGGG